MLPLAMQPYVLALKVGAYVVVGSALLIGGCHMGKKSERANTAEVQGQFDAYKDKMAKLTREVAQAAEQARKDYNAKSAEAARNYDDGRKSAEIRESVVAADLRAGNLRLRSEWAACMSAARKDPVGPAVGSHDVVAPVPAEAVARVLRVGDDADNQVRWLQAQLMAARALAESCGVAQ